MPEASDAPLLYSFRRCPYAIRARMAIAVSGVTVAMQEVALNNKPPALMLASAKGTVPVLVFPNGLVLEESLDIMRWALGVHDPERWLTGDEPALLAINDGPFKAALDRYKYPARYPEKHPYDARSAAMQILLMLEARLTSAPFLSGAHCAFSDVAIVPFVRQFRGVDAAWFDAQAMPNVQRWLARLLSTPLFQQVMQLKLPGQ
jgi:glutathione S-transferase